jgi:glycerol-3-phosphate acyltransferase PlsY
MPVLEIVTGRPWVIVAFTIGVAVAIFLLHRANIRRLLNGTEHRMTFRRSGSVGQAPS